MGTPTRQKFKGLQFIGVKSLWGGEGRGQGVVSSTAKNNSLFQVPRGASFPDIKGQPYWHKQLTGSYSGSHSNNTQNLALGWRIKTSLAPCPASRHGCHGCFHASKDRCLRTARSSRYADLCPLADTQSKEPWRLHFSLFST